MRDELFSVNGGKAINAALMEVSNNNHRLIHEMLHMLDMNEIYQRKSIFVGENSMSRGLRRAIGRFLNRLMMMPIIVQAELMHIIWQKLSELEEKGSVSSYKSLKGWSKKKDN